MPSLYGFVIKGGRAIFCFCFLLFSNFHLFIFSALNLPFPCAVVQPICRSLFLCEMKMNVVVGENAVNI